MYIFQEDIVVSRAVVFYSLSGNTREAAKDIARKLGISVFEIDLVKPLPRNTVRQMLVGGMQSTFGKKPKIKGVPDNIDYYDEIHAVFTFSGGGDNDRCIAQLSKNLKNIKTQVALADKNSEMAKDNKDKLEKFIMDIK